MEDQISIGVGGKEPPRQTGEAGRPLASNRNGRRAMKVLHTNQKNRSEVVEDQISIGVSGKDPHDKPARPGESCHLLATDARQ